MTTPKGNKCSVQVTGICDSMLMGDGDCTFAEYEKDKMVCKFSHRESFSAEQSTCVNLDAIKAKLESLR